MDNDNVINNPSGYEGAKANDLDLSDRGDCICDIQWNVERICDCLGGLQMELLDVLKRYLAFCSSEIGSSYINLTPEMLDKFSASMADIEKANHATYSLRSLIEDKLR